MAVLYMMDLFNDSSVSFKNARGSICSSPNPLD